MTHLIIPLARPERLKEAEVIQIGPILKIGPISVTEYSVTEYCALKENSPESAGPFCRAVANSVRNFPPEVVTTESNL